MDWPLYRFKLLETIFWNMHSTKKTCATRLMCTGSVPTTGLSTDFLLDNKDQKKAEKALIKAMHWRMEFGVNDMTDDYFPRELYQRGDPQLFGQNRQGKYIVWGGIRNKNEPFIDEMMDLNKRWMVYLNEQCDKFVRDKGYN